MTWKLSPRAAVNTRKPARVTLNQTRGGGQRNTPVSVPVRARVFERDLPSDNCWCWLMVYLVNRFPGGALALRSNINEEKRKKRKRGRVGRAMKRRMRSHLEVSVYYTLLMAILHRWHDLGGKARMRRLPWKTVQKHKCITHTSLWGLAQTLFLQPLILTLIIPTTVFSRI